MRPIISVVGRSESGKTTLIERLIAELKQRGYRVAVLKHSGEEVELDTVNKDSWRFSRAGSDISAVTSANKLAIFSKLEHDFTPQELAGFICWDCDLILTEGFKKSAHPKIEVHRKDQGHDLVSPPQQLVAVVTDEPLEVSAPQFSRDDVKPLADLIVTRIKSQQSGPDVDVLIDGTDVPLAQPTRDLLLRTLMAMVVEPKRVKDVHSLRISFRRQS